MEPQLFTGRRVITDVWHQFDALPRTHRPDPALAPADVGAHALQISCQPTGSTIWTLAVSDQLVPEPTCKLSLFAQRADPDLDERERIAGALRTHASDLNLLMTDPTGRLFLKRDHPYRKRFRDIAGDAIGSLERRVADHPGFTQFAYAPSVVPIIATALQMIVCEDACG